MYEQIHLPKDNIDKHIGIVFLTFNSTTSREQFCRNLNYPNKFLYLTYDYSFNFQQKIFCFSSHDIYEGPLRIKLMEFPDSHQSSNEPLGGYCCLLENIIIFIHFSLRFTKNTLEDEIAVKVGEIYINIQNKCELE